MVVDGSREEQLQKAFLELQSHSSALLYLTVQWKELEDLFDGLERLLQNRFEDLEQKGKENGKEKQSAAERSAGGPNKTSEKNPPAKESTENPQKTLPALKHDVNPRPELKSLCENMDGEGLREFLASAREVAAVRNEVPAALRCAEDPARLVLQTLDGFYPADCEGEPPTGLDAQRYACDLLLESLSYVLLSDEVSSEAKKDALKIAATWKSKMNPDDARIPPVEAHAFLQLLASYGISKEFKDDDFCTLVPRISSNPEAPELCRALQITHKIPDIVEKMSSSGKHIDAIRFVYDFGLVEKFPPVPLLKAFLEYARKASKRLSKKRQNTVGAKNYAASKEIDSLRNAIKCIEEHKLEAHISSKELEERVAQLQKDKIKRKRESRKRSREAKSRLGTW